MSYFTLLFVLFFFIYFCWTYSPLSLSFKSAIESIFETHLQATNLAQKDLHRPAKMAAQQSHFPCNGEAHFVPHVCMAYRLPQSFLLLRCRIPTCANSPLNKQSSSHGRHHLALTSLIHAVRPRHDLTPLHLAACPYLRAPSP